MRSKEEKILYQRVAKDGTIVTRPFTKEIVDGFGPSEKLKWTPAGKVKSAVKKSEDQELVDIAMQLESEGKTQEALGYYKEACALNAKVETADKIASLEVQIKADAEAKEKKELQDLIDAEENAKADKKKK